MRRVTKRFRELSMTLALLVLSLLGPAALAAFVLTRDPGPPGVVLAALDATTPTTAAGPAATTPAGGTGGILYTRGTAMVNWNGVNIPVANGSYAYRGGELISTASNAMGMLDLGNDNRIYICPGSRVSLARDAAGAYQLYVGEGTSRYVFGPETAFDVRANRGLVTPRAGAAGGPVVGEISVFQDHPGGVVCSFDNTVDVAGFGPGDGGEPIALGSVGAGEIVDLSRALRDERAATGSPVIMSPIPMPAEVRGWLTRNAGPSGNGSFIGYLCRCEQLKRYADADGIPDTAIAPQLQPPEGEPLPLSDPAPPLDPPEAPSVALVVPGVPDPADPGVLPPPAPPPQAPGPTVPDPVIPIGGSGGGITSTPS